MSKDFTPEIKVAEESKSELTLYPEFNPKLDLLEPKLSADSMDTRKLTPDPEKQKKTPGEFWKQILNQEVENLAKYYESYIRDPLQNAIHNYNSSEQQIEEFGRTLLDVTTKDEPFLVGQARKAFFGLSLEIYHLAKDLIFDVWKLIQFAIEIQYDPILQTKTKQFLSLFGTFLAQLTGTSSERQHALLQLKHLGNTLVHSLSQHFKEEWEKAKKEGREAELIGKWTADGIFIIGGTATAAESLLSKARNISKETKAVVLLTEKAGPELANQLTSLTSEIAQVAETKLPQVIKVLEEVKNPILLAPQKASKESPFTHKTLVHIFHGELGKKRKAVGYHHESLMGGEITSIVTPPNELGLYEAKVKIHGIIKDPVSSFFPKHWKRTDVLNAIKEAYENREQITRNLYRGSTKTNLRIDMYLDHNQKILTAFPVLK